MSTIAGIRKDAKAEGRTEGVAIGETRTNEKLVRMMLQDHKDIRETQKYTGMSAVQINALKKIK